MSARVEVSGRLLAWARARSGIEAADLERRFPSLPDWESGERSPTFKQLESFAQATHTPVGFLFLDEPPEEKVPIPDFRTIADTGVRHPSPELLDTIFSCQARQEWYREFALLNGEPSFKYLGSASLRTSVERAAAEMSTALRFHVNERGPSWGETLRLLIDRAEDAGILLMVNGVVGNNTHRKLDPEEFRGFVLVDPLAPVIFINGADTKAAQLFTLVHELAHLWLGEPGVDDANLTTAPTSQTERWCNAVAAEVLVPLATVRDEFDEHQPLTAELERLARRYKVSTLVVLRRLYDAQLAGDWGTYRSAYDAELRRVLEFLTTAGSGGNFYNTQPLRVSRRFSRAVISSTLEGQTLYNEAFQLLGFKSTATFHQLAEQLGVA
jgi:Zn-dependent peptidase ImmA (M78 family)